MTAANHIAESEEDIKQPGGLAVMMLGAMGVVYGDIGTSPLYTIREAFGETGRLVLNEANILGTLSLIFWVIMISVSIKYVLIITRVDNKGEGGVLALSALASRSVGNKPKTRHVIMLLGIIGIALFYGDSLITPAISVLGAIEGLQVATPVFEKYLTPLALIILVSLFLIQKRGTGRVGSLFGPVMVLWFIVIGGLGLKQIIATPQVLKAINPLYALEMFQYHGIGIFKPLGAVVLAITGAEALYADLGHFGRRPIQLAWFFIALPGLLLNYFGQGALLLQAPQSVSNPFYWLVPSWGLYPMVILATAATVIASQAVISGAFSLSKQAAQIGYLPRFNIRHTSEYLRGQIYIPSINWLLLLGISLLVLIFKTSSGLAAAYGLAVTGVMIISAIFAYIIFGKMQGRWSYFLKPLFIIVAIVDLAMFGSTIPKIPYGGWLPVSVAFLVLLIITSWRSGRKILAKKLYGSTPSLISFIGELGRKNLGTVSGTAVFMTANSDTAPRTMLQNIKHNKILHERNVLMTVITEDVPRVPESERIQIQTLDKNFHVVKVYYGFAQHPDIPKVLIRCARQGLEFDIKDTSFFLNRETIVPSKDVGKMAKIQENVFIFLSGFAYDATAFFNIPPDRVVELGAQVEV